MQPGSMAYCARHSTTRAPAAAISFCPLPDLDVAPFRDPWRSPTGCACFNESRDVRRPQAPHGLDVYSLSESIALRIWNYLGSPLIPE